MTNHPIKDQYIPPGFRLRHALRGHEHYITHIAWSPDGRILASTSFDGTIRLWDPETGKLYTTLEGHEGPVTSAAWAPDGKTLVSASADKTIRVWNLKTDMMRLILRGHRDWIRSVSWSPNGRILASGAEDYTIRLWDTETWKSNLILEGHTSRVTSVMWSPDGRTLFSTSDDDTICLWDVETGKLRNTLLGHEGPVLSIAWLPDKQAILSASADDTVRIWSPKSGRQEITIEGHSNSVRSISISPDSRLLASKSLDDTIRLWHCGTWETVAVLEETNPVGNWYAGLISFNPIDSTVLATLGKGGIRSDTIIRIWELDHSILLDLSTKQAMHYTNAKVVLVGDTGVGKSGLFLALTGQTFQPTDSTHGRHIKIFDIQKVELNDKLAETRETLLWDLAGQPGYRLIHQLHLTEIAVALVVFDARSETNPFAGVRHWDRALRQAQRVQGEVAVPLKKILVAARTDRSGVNVSQARIDALMQDLDFDSYFATSAKEGWQIKELAEAIREAIDWKVLPKVSSTDLFKQIKDFLVEEKKAGRLLSTLPDLMISFMKRVFKGNSREYEKTEIDGLLKKVYSKSTNTKGTTGADLLRQSLKPDERDSFDRLRNNFYTCIGRVESRGLVRRLSFGGLILLQPELLDAYASAMINAARDEPDGEGCLSEEDARKGRFCLSKDEGIKDKEQEKLLLIATVEDLLRHEIALRESTEAGTLLVFPSQFTRENPEAPDPKGKAVIFGFEGPVMNIYATLTVRLSRSGMFRRQEMWKNAATYTTTMGGRYGIFLRDFEEGQGEITLFFDSKSNPTMRIQFEAYIHSHLRRRALPQSIWRRRIIVCPVCEEPVTDSQVRKRRERGFDWIRCNVCETKISLAEERDIIPTTTLELEQASDIQRDLETATAIIQGKIATGDFDVFFAHNSRDKTTVEAVAEKLKQRGIYPWIDTEQVPPGRWFQDVIQEVIPKVKSAAIFIGQEGLGRWELVELRSFISQCVERNLPVIPILLPGVTLEDLPKNLLFLRELNCVIFNESINESEPLEKLVWGITIESP